MPSTPRYPLAILVSLLALVPGEVCPGFELVPADPRDCDRVEIVFERTLPRDCQWRLQTDTQELIFFPNPSGIRRLTVDYEIREGGSCRNLEVTEEFRIQLGVLTPGPYRIQIRPEGSEEVEATFEFTVEWEGCTARDGFVRGDANGDGGIDIADPITMLAHTFAGEPVPCLDALDADASASVEVTDPIVLLSHLFLGTEPPPAPYPDCRPAPGRSELGCEEPACREPRELRGRWLALPDGCVQCVECTAPPLETIVGLLENDGFEILDATYGDTLVCLACQVCPSGRVYAVRVSEEQALLLENQGWQDARPGEWVILDPDSRN